MDATDPRERDSIRRDLASPDDEVRRLAVERSDLLASDEALAALIERLGDASWRVRKAAIERLGAPGVAARSAPALARALADGENTGRRNAALEALVRGGSAALPALLEATRAPDADVRKQAVDALAAIAEPGAAARLVELLADTDANVRAAAADALGGLDVAPASAALFERVRADSQRLVRLAALRSLARLERAFPARELAPLLDDSHLRPAVFALLAHSEDPAAVELLLKGLESASAAAREAAMAALTRAAARCDDVEREAIAVPARSALASSAARAAALERLATGPLPVRLMLVQFLGLLALPDTALALLSAGRDEALAEVAVAALAGFGPAGERILAEAWHGLDAEDRVLACAVLARGSRADAGGCLITALADPDPALRTAAARALGERACGDALDALVRRLHAAAGDASGDAEGELGALCDAIAAIADARGREAQRGEAVRHALGARLHGAPERYRCAAARILARVAGPGAQQDLALLLSDPSEAVRRAAVEGCAGLAGDAVAEGLRLALADESARVRSAAAAALAGRPEPGVFEALLALAADAEPRVRAAALRGVARRLTATPTASESAAACALLERSLADEAGVAMAAAEALGSLAAPEACRLARGLLERGDPELVQAALDCLARHADADALTGLTGLLAHASWSVRAHAVEVLGERGVQRAVPALLRRLELEQDDFVRDALLRALRRLDC